MDKKKSILIYSDFLPKISKLSDEQAGKLFKGLLNYSNGITPEFDDILLDYAFEDIKTTIDRDSEKYSLKCLKNKEIAIERERIKRERNNTNVNERVQVSTNSTDKDNDKDNDIDNDNYNVINNNNINFDKLLSFLNSKTGRNFKIINEATKKKYNARLKEGYTSKDIANAIENAVNSDYHKENNFTYLTPEFFSRANTLDKYSNVNNKQKENNVKKSLIPKGVSYSGPQY